MTWQADLASDTYLLRGGEPHPRLLAVGWLGRGNPYPQGETPAEVFEKLTEMANDPWQPFVFMGLHQCELCQFDGPHEGSNLFIPTENGTLYATPAMIVHYINAHWYQPPVAFRRAVLACPPMRSQEYRKALAACPGLKRLTERRDNGGDCH